MIENETFYGYTMIYVDEITMNSPKIIKKHIRLPTLGWMCVNVDENMYNHLYVALSFQ